MAEVAKRMSEVRTDAVILLGQQGDMKGILTDHDVARHVGMRCGRSVFSVLFSSEKCKRGPRVAVAAESASGYPGPTAVVSFRT